MHRVDHWIGLWIDDRLFNCNCANDGRICDECRGRWIWLDNWPMSNGLYQNKWNNRDPDGNLNCGVLYNAEWCDRKCDDKYNFICKKGESFQSKVLDVCI